MTREELSNYDIHLVVDRSSSMGEKDGGTKTRWQTAEEATIGLARACEEFDKDGISVHVYWNPGKFQSYENVTSGGDKVKQIFTEHKPNGSTGTTEILAEIFNNYFKTPTKPIIVLVITDGEPDDPETLEKLLIDTSDRLETGKEIGVSFLQIGKNADAAKFLTHLDDALSGKSKKGFDIVDTKTFDEMGDMLMEDVLIAALTD